MSNTMVFTLTATFLDQEDEKPSQSLSKETLARQPATGAFRGYDATMRKNEEGCFLARPALQR